MSELVAFVFRDQFRAPEVLNELRRREFAWSKDLDQAVAITLNEAGTPRVQLSVDLSTKEGVGWARLWGSLLGSTLFMPGTEVLVDAVNGIRFSSNAFSKNENPALSRATPRQTREGGWWQEALRRSENFKRDVAALIEPNGSAIFMLLRSADVPVVLKQLRNYGDTIVHTSVSSEHDQRMLRLLTTSEEDRS